MTVKQAIAILEAERVLQTVGAGGPDCNLGTAWNNYLIVASQVVDDADEYCGNWNDLELVVAARRNRSGII
jgi:hypothetical protein